MKPNQLVQAAKLIHLAFGWRGLARRIAYEAQLRSGLAARQTPMRPDFSDSPRVTWEHRFDLDAIRVQYEEIEDLDGLRSAVVERADRILGGELELYGWTWRKVGWPPRWQRNDWTGYEYPRVHWTEISDSDPEVGDIKDVWELSRLPFTAVFARAYVLTGDDRYPEAWWQAVEDWAANNPPNAGVHWRCGQESSLRGMALCFGLSAFSAHLSSTPTRIELVQRILGATVKRVRPTLGYALSQRNNHAISELVFLLSVRAGERELLRLLLEVLDDQFYEDGSYSQQSFTYQRLAVQTLAWLLVTRPDLSPGLRARAVQCLADSREFLSRCSDPVSGWLPNYGANDGGLLFDLTTANYRNFRPLLGMLGKEVEDDHHREPAIWKPQPEVADSESDANEQPTAYHTLRGPRSLLFMRAGIGRHRPGHADQQSVDLWIDGRNVIRDPGTYRYTASAPWGNPFAGAECHNAPVAMTTRALHIGRFLTMNGHWAEVIHHAGTRPELLVVSRRLGNGEAVRLAARDNDDYTIIDVLRETTATSRWILDPCGGEVRFLSPAGEDSQAIDGQSPLSGWSSAYYADRERVGVTEIVVPRNNVSVALIGEPTGTSECVLACNREIDAWLTPDERRAFLALLDSRREGW